jgi:hypothetical protein
MDTSKSQIPFREAVGERLLNIADDFGGGEHDIIAFVFEETTITVTARGNTLVISADKDGLLSKLPFNGSLGTKE